jgi:hypothetical protein
LASDVIGDLTDRRESSGTHAASRAQAIRLAHEGAFA